MYLYMGEHHALVGAWKEWDHHLFMFGGKETRMHTSGMIELCRVVSKVEGQM